MGKKVDNYQIVYHVESVERFHQGGQLSAPERVRQNFLVEPNL